MPAEENSMETRPWGSFEILSDEPSHKVKRLTVDAWQRLSHQRHEHRAEHWYVVSGRGEALVSGRYINLSPGRNVGIPQGAWHRLESKGEEPLVIIEVQTGTYFGEDDIERRQDDYGRES
jgi:mannose-6-phosphate isomerase